MPGEKLSDDWTHVFPAVAAAYEACLEVEKELMRQQTSILTATDTKALEKKLVNIRILGYLLIFAPTNTARGHIAKTILADKDEGSDALTNRGGFYDQLFLRIFRKAKGRSPQASHRSRPSYKVTLADVAKTTVKKPTNHSEAKKCALVRDNFRCMVTGAIDQGSYIEYEELRGLPQISIELTECAHIFSEFTNVGIEEEWKRAYTENAWTIIREFGYQDVYDELGGTDSDIHRLQNVMTLKTNLCDLFDKLALWFESTGTPNSYKVCVCSSLDGYHAAARVPEHVEFTTERQDLPLPSPRYLEIHAACCRVAHMSGAADYYRDLDDDDPFVTKLRSFDPVGSDFSSALHARLLDLSERRAAATVSG